MHRRKFIIASSALTFPLAGCSGETAPAPAEGNKTPREDDEKSTDRVEKTTEEPRQTETAAAESGMANVVIDDTAAELGIDESGYSDDVYAAVDLTNVGNAVSGTVEVTADFLDKNGNYLDDWSESIVSLNPGETWNARVRAALVDQEKISDFEVHGEYEKELEPVHEGVDLASSALLAGEEKVKVRGVVENNMDRNLDYVEFNGKIYNAAGSVMGGTWTNEADIPAGSSTSFDPDWSEAGDRASKAVDHEVVLHTSVY